jgi:hypothetical protein
MLMAGPTAVSSRSQLASKEELFAIDIPALLVIGAAAVLLALPMLLYGPMPGSWDSYEHLNFAHHFSDQFWAGEWYPRWLMEMNHGLGTPTLFVYPPLPSYVYTLLAPVARVLHFDAFRAGVFLALFGSGGFAFLWLTTMVDRGASVVGAILYMLMPYHLAINYYHRSALSECWALVWMPLMLYFVTKVIRQNGVYLVGLAVAYALLILSHLITVLLFSLIPLAWTIFFPPRGKEAKSLLRVAKGMLLGIGLSSFYLISAFSQAKYFPVSRLPLWRNLDHHFMLRASTMLHGGGMIRKGSLAAASMIAVCLMCSAVVLAIGSAASKKRVYFWLISCTMSVWLMTSASSLVWRGIPAFHAAVQYPGRLTIIFCIASLPILAAFLAETRTRPLLSRILMVLLLLVGAIPWLLAYRGVWTSYDWELQTPLKNTSVNEYDGWFLAWPVPGLDSASALRASREARVRFFAGDGSASALVWKPRHIEIETNSQNGGEIVINQFYYPAWKAFLAVGAQAVDVEAAMPEGLVKLKVPPGHQQIRLEIPLGPAERIGQWITGLSLILCLAMITRIRSIFRSRQEFAATVSDSR